MVRGRVGAYNAQREEGILVSGSGQKVFFHRSSLLEGEVAAGEEVSFDLRQEGERFVAFNIRSLQAGSAVHTAREREQPPPSGDSGTGTPLLTLPRFDRDPVFARLRGVMGAIRIGRFAPDSVRPLPPLPQDHTSPEELRRLSGKGLDVEAGDIRLPDDGTLAFKNRRVVLYIRTPSSSYAESLDFDESWRQPRRPSASSEDSGPRFHIANCRTLEKMRQRGREDRYVVSVRDDGRFEMVTAGGMVSTRALKVCKNCLERLDWDGFLKAPGSERDMRVAAFSLAAFFKVYGRNL